MHNIPTLGRPQYSPDWDFFQKYGRAAIQLSPVLILFAMSQALVWLKDIDPMIKIYFIVGGFGITALWMILDIFTDKSDFATFLDIQNHIDAIDRVAQQTIYDGLQDIKLIDDSELEGGDSEKVVLYVINSLVFRALTPSVYQNHHGKELVNSGSSDKYIERKKKLVHKMFSGANAGYKQLVANRCGGHVDFEQAVDSVVCRWIRDDVVPAVRNACEQKIVYYNILKARKDLSCMFKSKTQERIVKNMLYINALNGLSLRSDITFRSRIILPANAVQAAPKKQCDTGTYQI